MSTRQWTLPARVYARPLELYAGKEISLIDLQRELAWLGYRASPDPSPGHFAINENTAFLSTRGFELGSDTETAQQVVIKWKQDTIQGVEQRESGNAAYVRLEPLEIGAIHPQRHEDRILLELSDLPPGFVDTLVAVEDRQFFSHFGVSIKGVLRAIWVNLKSGSKRQGASTLTQQLVKNLFLSNEKTWNRKIKEALMAIVMEWRYDKETILETFANEVFVAQDGSRAVHGFGLASQHFFDRPLKELEAHQYALLIGMLKAPTSYHPVRHPVAAKARRDLVLSLMQDQGVLDEEQYRAEKENDLGVVAGVNDANGNPAYLDAVKRQLLEEYALEDLQNAGLAIFTNYDPLVQFKLEHSVATTLQKIEQQLGKTQLPEGFLETAAVVTDATTGEIKAMVGGRQSRYAGFNRALDASRPVGSLLKPAIYLTAWQDPQRYTLSTIIEDTPIELPQPDGSIWSPTNFDETSNGSITTLDAFKRSLNLAAVNLGLELGVPAVINTLKKMGVTKDLPELPSLLLGAQGFTVMDIANIYQSISTDGFATRQRTIREVQDAGGQTLKQYGIDITRNINPQANYLLKYALTETMLTGTGRSAYQTLKEDFFVAGKTGTSDSQRDSWFAGFTGDYLAVFWVGNDENRPSPLTGSTGALPVWTEFIQQVSHESIDYTPPDGIEFSTIDPQSGKRISSGAACNAGLELPFIAGSIPQEEIACARGESRFGRWLRSLLR